MISHIIFTVLLYQLPLYYSYQLELYYISSHGLYQQLHYIRCSPISYSLSALYISAYQNAGCIFHVVGSCSQTMSSNVFQCISMHQRSCSQTMIFLVHKHSWTFRLFHSFNQGFMHVTYKCVNQSTYFLLPAQVYCKTQNLHLQTHVDIHTRYPNWGRGTYTKIQVVHINTAYMYKYILGSWP